MIVSFLIGGFSALSNYVTGYYASEYGDILLKTVKDENEAFAVMREYIKINDIFSMTTVISFSEVDGEKCKIVSFGIGATFVIRANSLPKYNDIEKLEIDIKSKLPCAPMWEYLNGNKYLPKANTLDEFDKYCRHSPLTNVGDGCNGRVFKSKYNYNNEKWKKYHWLAELKAYFNVQGG